MQRIGMANQVSKNVSLTPELDALIGAEVASGRYQNASEVVRAALRLLADHEVHLVPRRRPATSASGYVVPAKR
jgi:putative addiction module CopG family antidote